MEHPCFHAAITPLFDVLEGICAFPCTHCPHIYPTHDSHPTHLACHWQGTSAAEAGTAALLQQKTIAAHQVMMCAVSICSCAMLTFTPC